MALSNNGSAHFSETEKLAERVSRLEAALESTADGILVVASDGTTSCYNKKFLDIWNLPPDSSAELRGDLLTSFVANQLIDPAKFLSKVKELYSNPTTTGFDVFHIRGGRILEWYCRPQYIGDRVVGRVWSFRDVTQSKNLEEELRQSQKMEAVGRLAGGVAHDFNNLLMLIAGYVAQLLDDAALSGKNKNCCEQILANTTRATSLTRQLLAFSRRRQATPAVVAIQQALSTMMRARAGRIINISSVVAEMGNAGQANYVAAKAGLVGLTKAIAIEIASRNITVNAVAPGFIATPMTDVLSDTVKTELNDRIPLGRMGTARDVASAIVFLASDEAAYITGHVLDVNGGLYLA